MSDLQTVSLRSMPRPRAEIEFEVVRHVAYATHPLVASTPDQKRASAWHWALAMALQVYDDTFFNAPRKPILNDLPRPTTFTLYETAHRLEFRPEIVYYPGGLEDAKTGARVDAHCANAAERQRVPFPVPVAADAGSGGGLRPALAAYLCANGIVYDDARLHPSSSAAPGGGATTTEDLFAKSAIAELKAAQTAAIVPLGHTRRDVTSQTPGPHDSQPARRVAVTLLLPVAAEGKRNVNANSLVLLDAFALIAGSSNIVPGHSAPRRVTEKAATSIARFSVVCGQRRVSAFAQSLGIHRAPPFTTAQWKTLPCLCVSYAARAELVHGAFPLKLDGNDVGSVGEAVVVLQQAAREAQQSACGECVLPIGFHSLEHVAISDATLPGANGSLEPCKTAQSTAQSPFLALVADLCTKFKALSFPPLANEVGTEAMKRLVAADRQQQAQAATSDAGTGSGALADLVPRRHRFVRLCPAGANASDLSDPRHCVGVLFSSDDDSLVDFMQRCRDNVAGLVYGLEAPTDEDATDVCVLFWHETEEAIGTKLSTFAPRIRLGQPIAALRGGRGVAIRASLWPLARILASQFMVLPCTDRSVAPSDRNRLFSGGFTAFQTEMDATIHELKTMAEGIAKTPDAFDGLVAESEATTAALPPLDAETALLSALIGARLGAPCATLADAHAVAEEHSLAQRTEGEAWCALVASAIKAMGPDASIVDALRRAADALDTEPASKRRKTPTAESTPTTPHASEAVLPLFVTHPRDASMADSIGSLGSDLSSAETALCAPSPLRRVDSLVSHLKDKLNFECVLKLGALQSFSAVERVVGPSNAKTVRWPITIKGIVVLKRHVALCYDMLERCDEDAWAARALDEPLASALDALPEVGEEAVRHVVSLLFVEHARLAPLASDVDAFVHFNCDATGGSVWRAGGADGALVPSTTTDLAAAERTRQRSLLRIDVGAALTLHLFRSVER
jgi:hypothetical protein